MAHRTFCFGYSPDTEDAKFHKTIDSILFKDRNVQIPMRQQIAITKNTIQNFSSSIRSLCETTRINLRII